MNASSLDLIQQLLSNCSCTREKGWEFIYQKYYPMIRNMVFKYGGSEDDAVDIFQDGLLILNRNLLIGSFRNEAAINTYLFGICKNLWLKEYNRQQKQAVLQPELLLETRQQVDYLVNVDVVSILMNELQDDCRNILTEYYFNKRSMAELKEMFNVSSIQAAKNKKWRCLTYLTKIFKEKGVSPVWG